ncbi:DUF2523 family protein, partial [Pseudomonas aeruginosa]|uniref:DUF2523 family protein n=1 Tax=Pseudomonas aeruginosa TaxID=287 RepID=UPI0031B77525
PPRPDPTDRPHLPSGAVGADVASILGLAKFDVAMNIIFAAVVAKAVISGMDKASGSITKIGSVGKGS